MIKSKPNLVLQFRIELLGIEPLIWRRIQVPSKYSFWDLHVAIQDAMGWLDYHLHAFYIQVPRKKKEVEIGIPDDDFDTERVLPGWEIPVVEYFSEIGKPAHYKYDFGDGWDHIVLFEGILLKDQDAEYPRCLAGERACPPEDCGGFHGYYRLVEKLKNPKGAEYPDLIQWLKGHAKNYYPYDPNHFNPEEVMFWNPKKRLKMAFS